MNQRLRASLAGCVLSITLALFGAPAASEPNDLNAILSAIDDPYPLRTADTSSPRDTLRTFIRDFSLGMRAWRNDESYADVYRPLHRAYQTFDATAFAVLDRIAGGAIQMAFLREILDRIELPSFDQIPGDAEVAAQDIKRWIIPNTKIEIVKIEEGPKAGQFLFSKNTIKQLPNYYEMAKDLPYKKGAFIDVYQEIVSSPGGWLPRDFAESFPDWASRLLANQAAWQWIAAALSLITLGITIWLLYRVGTWWDSKQGHARAWYRFGRPLSAIGTFLVAAVFENFASLGIGLAGFPLQVMLFIAIVIKVAALVWLTVVLADRLADGFAQNKYKPPEKRRVDAALMRILFRLLSLVFLAYIGIYAAETVGIPIAPLIAGLGVGGLAIALAVRPTLENIIGGLTLFADRPVRVGDFCRYGDEIGTVEEIGLRSTRIRSLERTRVTVPNAEFAQMKLDNFAARDQRLLKTVLGLRYETTPEQLRYVLAELRKMLLGHPKVTPAPARVRFVGYSAYSLDLEVFAYLRCQDQDEFLAIQEDILLRMADIISDGGTGFAFPSQTMYFTRDGGLDVERGQKAEAEVENWRENRNLPFPEFDPGLRWEMEDILDYPQRGAYDFKYRKGLSEEVSRKPKCQPHTEPQIPSSTEAAERPPPKPTRMSRWLSFARKHR